MIGTVRAAYYVRVSTAEQIDNTSLSEQRRLCRERITAKGWNLVGEYADEGQSGTDRDRPQWRQMLADARAGKVDAVVVAALDRFSRNAGDAIHETDALDRLGVVLVVVKQDIDMSSPAGKLMRTILAGVAEMERDTIVARTSAGQRARAATGGWPGGDPAFGWRREGTKRDCRVVPDARERQVLDRAFDLLVKHRMTAGQAADVLNAEGLRPRSATHWEYQNLKQILRRESLHTGRTLWGRADGRSASKTAHHTRTDRDGNPKYGAPVEVEMGNPPFTKRQFDQVQRALARRALGAPLAPAKSQMLTGRVFGECGAHYNGVTLTTAQRAVYKCSARRHRGVGAPRCSDGQLDAPTLDRLVWGEVVQLLSDPARLEALARQWLELPEGTSLDDHAAALVGLEAQIAVAKRRHERALDRADSVDQEDVADHERRVDRYVAELRALRHQHAGLAALAAEATEQRSRVTDLVRLAEQAHGRLADMPASERREVVALLGLRVEVAGVARGRAAQVTIHGQIDPGMFGGGARPSEPPPSGPAAPGTRDAGSPRAARLPDPAGHRRIRGLPRDPGPADAALTPRGSPGR